MSHKTQDIRITQLTMDWAIQKSCVSKSRVLFESYRIAYEIYVCFQPFSDVSHLLGGTHFCLKYDNGCKFETAAFVKDNFVQQAVEYLETQLKMEWTFWTLIYAQCERTFTLASLHTFLLTFGSFHDYTIAPFSFENCFEISAVVFFSYKLKIGSLVWSAQRNLRFLTALWLSIALLVDGV